MNPAQLRAQIADLASKGLAVVDDDSLTMAEKATALDGIETDLKAKQDDLKSYEQVETQRKALVAATEGPAGEIEAPVAPTGRKSLGEQFTDSDGFKGTSFKSGRFSTGAVELDAPGLGQKATFTEAAGGSGGIIPTYLPGVTEILFRRLVVADLFPQGSTDRPTIIYLKESSVTNAAAAVAEGGAKPGSDLNLTQVTENVKKLATTLKVSDEALEDISFLQSYINARLTLFVKLAEEDQLLNGSGSGANLTGLLNRSGLQTAQAKSTDSIPDAIYKEITKIRINAFVEPDGIVMHPTDWQSVRLSKDANGQYYAGGPFTGAYGNGGMATQNQLWGMPVVVTTALSQGTAVVGAFGIGAQILRKGGLTVEATNSNEDDFLKNLVAIRAEERLALAVYRPGAFGTVTGL
jgi:HK97 family phage major capsid protein